MARRTSGRRLSMSRAAKEILREKKKKKKRLAVPEKEPEGSSKGFWILVIAALAIVGLVLAQVLGSG